MCGAGKRWRQGRHGNGRCNVQWQQVGHEGHRCRRNAVRRQAAASGLRSRTLEVQPCPVPRRERSARMLRLPATTTAVGCYDDCGCLLRRLRLPCYTCDGHFCTTGTGTATDGAKRVRRGADREPQLVTQTQPYGPYGCGHEPPHAPSSSSFQRPRAARAKE